MPIYVYSEPKIFSFEIFFKKSLLQRHRIMHLVSSFSYICLGVYSYTCCEVKTLQNESVLQQCLLKIHFFPLICSHLIILKMYIFELYISVPLFVSSLGQCQTALIIIVGRYILIPEGQNLPFYSSFPPSQNCLSYSSTFVPSFKSVI